VATGRQKSQVKAGESDPPEHPKDKRADYLTTRQLAEVLQVSEGTIHRLRRAGRIPAVLLTDKLIRFNLRDVQRALRQQSGFHSADGTETEAGQEPIPQLSFEDVYPDFSEEQ
jgi:excisionase family DNA binding protein